jgi:predicted dehydrogenase
VREQKPLMRKQLRYEWHWFRDTRNGEIGDNGVHVIDIARWARGQVETPPRSMSIGGRFGSTTAARRPTRRSRCWES